MNTKYWLAFLAFVAVLCVAAVNIEWYSQQPNLGAIQDTDVGVFERQSPHAYGSFSAAQLKAYIGGGGGLVGPSITSFVNNKNNVEIGSTVTGTVLTWTLGGSAPTSQTVNQSIGSVPVGTLTATDPASFTVNRTYTLTVSNAQGTASANTSVTFLNKRYWGPQALTSLTDAQIRALNSELASGFAGFNHTIVCASQYIYFAFPTAFGVPNVNVNGLLNTAWTITSGPFVNASGATVNYYVYRSNNLLTGTYIVQLVP